MSEVSVDAVVGCSIGALSLDVELAVGAGQTVAVLGPNGAGKSTLLRCLAGLLPLDRGRVRVGDEALDDPRVGTFVPAERRPIGMVFQDYLLFPNLSALDNVAFGLRARGTGRAEARQMAAAWLARVGLTDHAQHRPDALSGGQAQRVALARALAPTPQLLLLDEPLAALDAGTRRAVRGELRQHLTDFAGACVLVTHDPVDAYALADHVVIVEGGRMVQSGQLAEIAAHPRSSYVAELVGVNLLTGHAHDGVITLDTGGTVVAADAADGPTFVVIAPHSVALYRRAPEGSPRNVWAGTVQDIDRRADRVRVQLGGAVPLVAEITQGSLGTLGLVPGDEVWASVKATDIVTSPA